MKRMRCTTMIGPDPAPRPRRGRIGPVLCLAALAVLSTGCTTTKSPSVQNSHSPPSLAALGNIGVTATSTVPKFILQHPLSRSEAGEATARQIVFLGGDDFTDGASMLVAHLTLGLSPFVLSAVATPGRVVAEAMAIPEKQQLKATSSLEEVISRFSLQDELRTRVVEQAIMRGSIPIKMVRKPFPPGRETEFSRMSCVMNGTLAWLPRGQTAAAYLASHGVDTVLELQLLHPGLKGTGRINPSLALCVDVRARLLKATSGEELWHCDARYRSPECRFAQWADDDAKKFRRELDRCFASLADQIVDQLVGGPGRDAGPVGVEFARN